MSTVPYAARCLHYAERANAAQPLVTFRASYNNLKDVQANVVDQLQSANFQYGEIDNTSKPQGTSSVPPSQVRRQVQLLLARPVWEAQQQQVQQQQQQQQVQQQQRQAKQAQQAQQVQQTALNPILLPIDPQLLIQPQTLPQFTVVAKGNAAQDLLNNLTLIATYTNKAALNSGVQG